ncbi:MAG: Oxygen-independent coproporphyrinogen III oxidase [Steroidobacteraceae bacterium]|nr:Oxygen-independent coproporphyrinogen III oxidase [Steroidobacteraceae bacterium]
MSATPANGARPVDPLRRPVAPGAGGLTPARWSALFDEAAFRREAARSNADLIPRPLAIALRTVDGARFERLLREIELVARLFDRDRDVLSLHVDCGAGGALATHDLEVLANSLDRHFHFAPRATRHISIDIAAGSVRCGDLADCHALGFDGVAFAAADADANAARAVELARREGMRSVSVDSTLTGPCVPADLLASRPDVITCLLPRASTYESAIGDLEDVAKQLGGADYGGIGLDLRALPWLDATGPVRISAVSRGAQLPGTEPHIDLIGLGIGAVSRIHDAVCQNYPDAERWVGALDAAGLPVWRGLVLDSDEQLRMEVIGELLRAGEVAIDAMERRFGIDFHRHFSPELAQLRAAFGDLVEAGPYCLRVTSQGRLALRIIAACFDKPGRRPHP